MDSDDIALERRSEVVPRCANSRERPPTRQARKSNPPKVRNEPESDLWSPAGLNVRKWLFAYLTLLSVLGFLQCAAATLLAGNIAHFQALASASATGFDDALLLGMKGLFVLTLAGVTGAVLSCTALGLYFLAERVHQEFG